MDLVPARPCIDLNVLRLSPSMGNGLLLDKHSVTAELLPYVLSRLIQCWCTCCSQELLFYFSLSVATLQNVTAVAIDKGTEPSMESELGWESKLPFHGSPAVHAASSRGTALSTVHR